MIGGRAARGAGARDAKSRAGAIARVAAVLALLIAAVAAAGPARAVEIQRVVSPAGIEAWLVEDRTQPVISLAVGFRGGAALDPAGREGVAEMVSGLLDEGAGDLDSEAFQQRLADLAVDLSFSSGLDNFTGTLRTLTANRDGAFELLRLALTAPRFDAAPVERIRGQLLARLADAANDPGEIASRVWWRTVFPEHPYGRRPEGSAASLAAIEAEDLRGFVAGRFARDNLFLAVVGDIDAVELRPLLDRTFAGLPAKAAPLSLPAAIPAAAGETIVIDRAVPQSVVLLGQGAVKRDDPDFYAAYVVNHVLGGGGFSSRLTHEVRELRGLAYSVSTSVTTLDEVGLLFGQVATQNARVAESIGLIREEWRRLAEDGPTAGELADAKLYLTGSFPLRLSSTLATARTLVGVRLEDLGIDYLDRRNGYIEAVTLEDARRVARRLLDPARLTIVVVGQPDGVTPTRPAPKDAS